MPERVTIHKPNFFERLGDGRWFGHGRRFGIQMGSLEQILQDPFNDIYDHTKFNLGWWWDRFPQGRVEHARRVLAQQVNTRLANNNLIPRLEEIMYSSAQILMYGRGSILPISNFNRQLQNPAAIAHFYHNIIIAANTAESMPYLLQALNSSFRVREYEPIHIDPEVLVGRISEADYSRPYQEWNAVNWTKIHYEHIPYDNYQVVYHYDCYTPFAELAKTRLEEISVRLDDQQKAFEVHRAIEQFDETKQNVITETYVRQARADR